MLAINYTTDNRGSIQFRERRKQIIDFSGLRFGNITPTDCDGFIEYHNKAFVFFEIKHRDAPVPRGQLLALTRLVDDLRSTKKHVALIIAEHKVDNTDDDIQAHLCSVRHWYNGSWHKFEGSLKSLIVGFINYVSKEE